MTINLDELRKTAEAATPGPWTAETHFVYTQDNYHAVYSVDAGDSPVISQLGCGCCDVGLEVSKPDAEFVTAFNPATVLALLSSLEQAERNADTYQTLYEQRAETLEQAEQAVQRVREVASEYRPSIPEEVLHEVMKDLLRALDGDARRLADQGLGDNHARTTKNGDNNE